MVVGFRLEVEDDINGSVFFVRLRTDVHLFGVEVTGLCNFASRTHKVGFREQVARAHAQFAANHLFVEAVVTVNHHLVDGSLFAFEHAHFQCDGVAFNLTFNRNELVEQITVVHVKVGNCVVVLLSAFVEQFLVVYIAFFNAEHIVEYASGIHGVAHPVDVADVVFLAFVDSEIDVDGLFVVVHHAVLHDDGIAVAFFVIFVDDELLVGFKIVGHEFLLAEEANKVALFVGFFHSVFHSLVGEHFVAVDVDFVHFDFFVLVNYDVNNHLVFVAEVLALHNVHVGILEAFVVEIVLNNQLGTVGNVHVHLVAFHQAEALLKVFALAFFHAFVVDLRYAGLLAKLKFEPSLVVVDFFDVDFHLREQTLTPQALSCVGDVVARDFHHLTNGKARIAHHDVVLVVVDARHLYAGYFVFLGHACEDNLWVVDSVVSHLCECVGCRHTHNHCQNH